LVEFAGKLEAAVKLTIEKDRVMTTDVAKVSEPPINCTVSTEEFIETVKRNLEKLMH